MAKMNNTLRLCQAAFLQSLRAHGYQIDRDAVDPVVPLHAALAAVADCLAYETRRADALEEIAKQALALKPTKPFTVKRERR